ncbi:MAG: hypothetical protein M0R46_13310 [Candidatus Muirbacterium halophilum]|nr:hypothetical protein [Candidatus Muirbacterium halophilum]
MFNVKKIFNKIKCKELFKTYDYEKYYVICKANVLKDNNINFHYLFTINKSYKVKSMIDYGKINGQYFGKKYTIITDDGCEMQINEFIFDLIFIDLQKYRNEKLNNLAIF